MNVLKQRDFLEVKLNSLIADYDKDVIINLYQPIIGYTACIIYFTLWTEANNQKISSLITHESLFAKMKIKTSDFVDARQLLEGVGLLKTFINKTKDINYYVYQIFAPRTPVEFFDNALFYGMLIKNIGENAANKLKSLYLINIQKDMGEEISTSFKKAFSPDFNDQAFAIALKNKDQLIGRRRGKVISSFSYEKFVDSLKKVSQINVDSISSKEMKEIERLATLNGVDEDSAASGVAKIYDTKAVKGKRIDFRLLAKVFQDEDNYKYLTSFTEKKKANTISSSSGLGGKINLMETISPKDYLSILQNGSKPASADLKLINDISMNFHLNNSVINALIDFVLAVNNNVLSRPYCEKVAASLAREGVTTTVDAMNYLKKVNSPKKKQSVTQETMEQNEEPEEEINWEDLINDIEGN